jgi:3-oxoacyl-[acyl-carrier-protein] synthase II
MLKRGRRRRPEIVISASSWLTASTTAIADARPRPFSAPPGSDRNEVIARRLYDDVGPSLPAAAPERIACTVTSSKLGIAPLLAALDRGAIEASAWRRFLAPPIIPMNARGPVLATVSACATGLAAIARGVMLLEDDEADLVYAGAIEGSIHPFLEAGFRRMGVLSSDRPRPFDRRRDGFVMAEGGGIFCLERQRDAAARGGRPLGRLLGFAMRAETVHPVIGAEDGASIAALIEAALLDADLDAESVAYLHLHGTGTRRNDPAEIDALRRVFGQRGPTTPASSTKALTGHCLGAAGAVEACLTLEALRCGILPPNHGLEEIDESCHWDGLLTAAQPAPGRIGLVLSYGFGGHMAALLIEGFA